MKTFLLFTLFLATLQYVAGQSIVSSSTSKSGILVGSNANFAGINFETATDKFSVNYKWIAQDSKHKVGRNYPHFFGFNVNAGTKIKDNQSAFISDDKWKGGVDLQVTIHRTWDKSKKLSIKETEHIDGATIRQGLGETHQHSLYISASVGVERTNLLEKSVVNSDTTFAVINNPLQNIFTITPGYFGVHSFGNSFHFSWAVSANVSFINESTRKLEETTTASYAGLLYNSKDSSAIQLRGKDDTYFVGIAEREVYIVPRADLFFRWELGDQKPIIGFLVAYSPLVSSLDGVNTRHAISFGPTIGLPTFPDQVLFSFQNELVQDKEGDMNYGLTFTASFPIRFK